MSLRNVGLDVRKDSVTPAVFGETLTLPVTARGLSIRIRKPIQSKRGMAHELDDRQP